MQISTSDGEQITFLSSESKNKHSRHLFSLEERTVYYELFLTSMETQTDVFSLRLLTPFSSVLKKI